LNVIHSDDGLFRGGFDPADIMLSVCLPGVKELMPLVASIYDARFPWRQNPGNERPFRPFAVLEENFLGNAAIEIKADVNLGLFRTIPVVGLVHGQNSLTLAREPSIRVRSPNSACPFGKCFAVLA